MNVSSASFLPSPSPHGSFPSKSSMKKYIYKRTHSQYRRRPDPHYIDPGHHSVPPLYPPNEWCCHSSAATGSPSQWKVGGVVASLM